MTLRYYALIGSMSPTQRRLLPELSALAPLCGNLGCQDIRNAEMNRRCTLRSGRGNLGRSGKLGPALDHGRDFGMDLIELVASDSVVGRREVRHSRGLEEKFQQCRNNRLAKLKRGKRTPWWDS